MNTDELIAGLVADLRPVRRLPHPTRRVLSWLAISVPAIVLVVLAAGVRSDIETKLADVWFLVQLVAALATAVAAAYATFRSAVPGHRPRLLFLPLVPFLVWLAVLGQQCLVQASSGPLSWSLDPLCLPAIAVAGAVPAIAIVVMARKGAVLDPLRTALLGGLAASALGYFALRLFHYEDAALTVLVWQFGAVALLSGLSARFGSTLFKDPFARA